MILLFANNAVSTLASPINVAAVAVQLAAGDGAKFPNPVVGQEFFKLTFVDTATGLITEIVNCTQRVGDVLTIVRAQEGTTAQPWLAGDSAKNMPTAQTQSNFIQVQQAQAGLTNYAPDTGTPNNYVVALTPAVTTRIQGLYVRLKAAPGNTNTGPSTLNLGAGSFPIINPDGSQLGANAIIGGGIFEVVDDGVNGYQLISASQQAQTLAGAATTGDISWRPTGENKAGWLFANATTIGNAASGASQYANALAFNLFAWHWNNFSNTQCPVFTSTGGAASRGTNAAADFAANMRIQVLDMRGIVPIGVDGGTGRLTGVPVSTGNINTPGSSIGQALHALAVGETPPHSHNGSGTTGGMNASNPHSHGVNGGVYGGTTTIARPQTTVSDGFVPLGTTAIGINNADINHGHAYSFTTDNGNGLSGTAHNVTQLGMAGTWYLKL
jgi:hypothetical protein